MDVAVTMFAAALFPFIYAPILKAIFDEDYLTEERLEQRQEHLAALLKMMLETFRSTL